MPLCSLYEGTKHSLASQALKAGVLLEFIDAALGDATSQSANYYARLKGVPVDRL